MIRYISTGLPAVLWTTTTTSIRRIPLRIGIFARMALESRFAFPAAFSATAFLPASFLPAFLPTLFLFVSSYSLSSSDTCWSMDFGMEETTVISIALSNRIVVARLRMEKLAISAAIAFAYCEIIAGFDTSS